MQHSPKLVDPSGKTINNEVDEIKNKNFECKKCAACCRIAKCNFLGKDNLCSIYKNRPIMCNVKAMFILTGGNKITAWDNYIALQTEFCNFLRRRERKERMKKMRGKQ